MTSKLSSNDSASERPNRFAKYIPQNAQTPDQGKAVALASARLRLKEKGQVSEGNRFAKYVPEPPGRDLQTVENAFLKAHKAGDTKAAGVLAAEVRRLRDAASQDNSTDAGAPPEVANPKTSTPNEAAAFGLADTLSMGFADELGSGLGSVIEKVGGDKRPIGEIYSDILERGRGLQAKAAEDYPLDYGVGQVGGVVATLPIGVGKAVVQTGVKAGGKLIQAGRAVLESAKQGAKQGAVYGFGSGEDGIENRLVNSGKTAAAGAVLNPAIKGAVKVIAAPVKALASTFQNKANFAGKKVAQAAERAGTTIPKAMQEVQRLQKTNPDTRLVDVLGNPGMRLARAVHTKGGEGGEKVTKFLNERQVEQGPRLTKAITKSLGNPNQFYKALDENLAALKTNAKPFYETAYASKINYAEHGPAITRAWNMVPERLRSKVVSAANDLLVSEGQKAKAIGDVIGRGKDGRMTPQPSVEQWDYIKRGLDAVIESTEGQAASGGMSSLGRSLSLVKKELLKTIDKAVPDFANARKIYSDDLTIKNALEEGRKALNADPEAIARKLASLDNAAADMYRIGFARAVNDAAGRVGEGGDVISRVWASPARKARLKAVFGDEGKFRQFADLAEHEAATTRLNRNVTGGSQTANKLNDLEDAGSEFIIDAATQGSTRAVLNGLKRYLQNVTGFTEKRANEVAELLLSKSVTPGVVKAGNRYQMSVRQKALLDRVLNGATRSALAIGQQPRPQGQQ